MKLVTKPLVAIGMLSVSIAMAGAAASDPTLEQIASYRTWTRVNPQLLIVDQAAFAG